MHTQINITCSSTVTYQYYMFLSQRHISSALSSGSAVDVVIGVQKARPTRGGSVEKATSSASIACWQARGVGWSSGGAWLLESSVWGRLSFVAMSHEPSDG